jgi:hypothetical protein
VKDTDSDIVAFVEKGVRQGLRPAKIREQMEKIKDFDDRIPETRALQRLVSDLIEIHGGNPKNVGILDGPFEWNRLEDYGLPWESSSYILGTWAKLIDSLPYVAEFSKTGEPYTLDPIEISHEDVYSRFQLKARETRWWWRIHQVDPGLDSVGVVALARCFSTKEYYRDVVGLPLILSDLEAMLAYRPWTSNTNSERYLSAVRDGRIPRLQELSLSEAQFEVVFGRMPFDSELRDNLFRGLNLEVILDVHDKKERPL